MKIRISPKNIFKTSMLAFVAGLVFLLGFFANNYYNKFASTVELLNPFVDNGELISKPLLAYSISNLQKREYQVNKIILEKVIAEEDNYTTLLFSYKTLGKKMTGQMNIPDNITANPEQFKNAIVMIRGYVPEEIYETGVGTKNAAAVFAKEGYITIAPDFFGFGESDPETENTWVARFEKPINIVELIKSIQEFGIPLNLESERTKNNLDLDVAKISNVGIWAHSNGGQIALTTLEIMRISIPTTLWAPVTAPFPYSILYFSDELADEGKEQRKWIAMFEEDYDVLEFSLTQHLDGLTGPIQIQHGDSDDAALIFWSQEFVDKIKAENQRRQDLIASQSAQITTSSASDQSTATTSGTNAKPVPTTSTETEDKILDPVEINLITYPNTNHNMVPNWNRAVQRDLQFFSKWLIN